MRHLLKIVLPALFVVGLMPTMAHAGGEVKLKTDLQSTMQRHIERTLVNGAITNLDMETGTTQQLYPTEAHPMILAGDGFFVLCSDLKSADGTELPVDYYVKETEGIYHVFHTEIDNREPLRKLMKINKVNRL